MLIKQANANSNQHYATKNLRFCPKFFAQENDRTLLFLFSDTERTKNIT